MKKKHFLFYLILCALVFCSCNETVGTSSGGSYEIKIITDYKSDNTKIENYTGTPSWTIKVQAGELLEEPIPKWDGYSILYWEFVNSAGTIERFDFSRPIYNNYILYPFWYWKGLFSITYITNTEEECNYPNYYSFYDPDYYLPILSRQGYHFCGWYENENFDGEPVSIIPEGSTGSKTFYAKWEIIIPEPVYTITYKLNGGEWEKGYSINFSYKSSFNTFYLPQKYMLEKDNYTFLGWYENPDFSGESISYISTGSIGDKTFYAKWEPITYSINYYLNNGEWIKEPTQTTYTVEDKIILPTINDLKREGYTFVGWCTDWNSTNNKITEIPKGSSDNKNLYAKWSKDIEEMSVILESVSGDKEIAIENLKDSLKPTTTTNNSLYSLGMKSFYWMVDGIRIDSSYYYNVQLSFNRLNLEAGYHNATFVIITDNGTVYSATAVIVIKK